MRKRRGLGPSSFAAGESPAITRRCALITSFVFVLFVLVLLQMRNVLTWCSYPHHIIAEKREYVTHIWRAVDVGQCSGPVFTTLQNNKLEIDCKSGRDAQHAGMYKVNKFDRYQPLSEHADHVDDDEVTLLDAETVWTRCDEGIYGAQENLLVQNIPKEELRQKQKTTKRRNEHDDAENNNNKNSNNNDNNDLRSLSVLVILVSSLSREHFSRSMPVTHKLIMDMQREFISKFETFDFIQYNAVGVVGADNQAALLSGYTEPGETGWVWEGLQDKGFVSMFGEEACAYPGSVRSRFPSGRSHLLDVDFSDVYCDEGLVNPRVSEIDIEGVHTPASSTPAAQAAGNVPGTVEGRDVWRHGVSCLGNRPVHDLLIDYTESFLRNYNPGKTLSISVFHTANEPTQIRAKTMDHDLSNYIKRLTGVRSIDGDGGGVYYDDAFSSGSSLWGNNTPIIILASDQGEGNSPYYHHTKSGWLEHKRPFLYMFVPRTWLSRHPAFRDNLRVNALSRLVTPYDVHATLLHIGHLSEGHVPGLHSENGMSLFTELPNERSCEAANIPGYMCTCERTWFLFFAILFMPMSILAWWCILWGRGRWIASNAAKRTVYVNPIVFR
eukprot:TRINITY_DN7545_c0_g2_i2.p1 TRINITY_DN7545_c0_g2~~TRINITY_DN7545_c0_g2_i2.p1  ORF type:complete len:610 (-),score=73.80 TRINITY_DN7545_c0_g2_i2:49-1878(-)